MSQPLGAMKPLRQALIRELVIRGMSPKTQQAYVASVYGLAKQFDRSPELLSNDEIKAYLFSLHEKKRPASSINQITSGLRFFYRHVLNRSIQEVEASLPRAKQEQRLPRAYALQEIDQLLKKGTGNAKHRLFLMTVYSAGLRVGEACRLKREHMDVARMLIRVEQSKGRKDRDTVLSPRLLEHLESFWKIAPPSPWVFHSNRRPEHPIDIGTGQRIFVHALQRAGLPNKGGIHSLRHSFATHLVESGVELTVVQRLLGHRNLRTTVVYLHVRQGRLGEIKSPLDLLPSTHY